LLQFEIVTPVTAALMHRTAEYFITFTRKYFVPSVAAISAELRAEQYCWTKSANCTISVPLCLFCAWRPILRTFANSAQN